MRAGRHSIIAAVSALGLVALAACGGGGSSSASADGSAAAANGTPLKVGVIVTAPTVYVDSATEKFYGPAIDLTEAIAKELGRPIEYVKTSWDSIVAALQTKQIDLAAPAMYETPERLKAIDFVTWTKNGSCYALAPDRTISSFDDLNSGDIKAALASGTGQATAFPAKYPEADSYSIQVVATQFPLEEIVAKRANAVPFDAPLIYVYSKKFPDLNYFPSDPETCVANPDLAMDQGVGIRKDDPDKERMQKVADDMREQLNQSRLDYIKQEAAKE
jgi:polar amino acid transport system substrate-binding protein